MSALLALVLVTTLSGAARAEAPNCADGGTCALGDVGPDGGKIIAINPDLQNDPSWTYLQLSPAGWSGGQEDPWGWMASDIPDFNGEQTDNLTGSALGDGVTNTNQLLSLEDSAGLDGNAAKIAREYGAGWSLPSTDEMLAARKVLWEPTTSGTSDGLNAFYSTSSITSSGQMTFYAEVFCWDEYPNISQGLSASMTQGDALPVRPVRLIGQQIQLDPNYGSEASITKTVVVGDVLASPARRGYSFDGWFDAPSGGNLVGQAGDQVPNLSHIYAQWSAVPPLVITFNGNPASVTPPSRNVVFGDSMTLPAAPTRTGYRFAGWWDAKKDGSFIGDALGVFAPTESQTLYALWAHNVYFNANNANSGTAPEYQPFVLGGTAWASPDAGDLVREGFSFGGWSLTRTGLKIVDAKFVPSADVILYAVWNDCQNDAVCSAGDQGPGGGKIFYVNEDRPVVYASASQDSINYWLTEGTDSHLQIGDTITISGFQDPAFNLTDATVTAIHDSRVNIFYVANSTDAQGEQTQSGILHKFAGWDFMQMAPGGWSGSQTDPGGYIPTVTLPEGVTLGEFSGNSLGSGVSNTDNLLSLGINDPVDNAALIAHNYGPGWFLPSASELMLGMTALGYDQELRDANSLSESYWSSSIASITDSPHTGSVNFLNGPPGLGITSSGTDLSRLSVRPVRLLDKVNFRSNFEGGGQTSSIHAHGGADLTLPTISRVGFNFLGWWTAPDGGDFIGNAADTYKNTVSSSLYAHWESLAPYVVTFDGNPEVIAPDSVEVDRGQSTVLPTPTKRIGFAFAGWWTAKSGGELAGLADALYQPNADVDLFARWTVLSPFVLTYDGNPTSVTPGSVSVEQTQSVVLPTLAARSGFIFAGWWSAKTSGSLAGLAGAEYTPTASSKVYARWTAKKAQTAVKLPASIKKSSGKIALSSKTKQGVAIKIKVSGKCSLTVTRSKGLISAYTIKAAKAAGKCSVTISAPETAVYAALKASTKTVSIK